VRDGDLAKEEESGEWLYFRGREATGKKVSHLLLPGGEEGFIFCRGGGKEGLLGGKVATCPRGERKRLVRRVRRLCGKGGEEKGSLLNTTTSGLLTEKTIFLLGGKTNYIF